MLVKCLVRSFNRFGPFCQTSARDGHPGHDRPRLAARLGSPPFPEFVSGPATQSAATAQVLADMFGAQTAFVDDTHQGRGAGFEPRAFASFAAFADEAASSRLYGGIHFRSGNEVGLVEGQKVGRNVSALRFYR